MRKALPGPRTAWKIAYVALSALLTLLAVLYFANLQASAASPVANEVTVIQTAVVDGANLGVTVDNASATSSQLAFDVTVGSGYLSDLNPVKYYTLTEATSSCQASSASYISEATNSGDRYTVPISSDVKTVCVSVYAKEMKRNRFHQQRFAYGYYAITVNATAAEPTRSETAVTTEETVLVLPPAVAPKIEARVFLGTMPPATLPSNIQAIANADQDIDNWSYIVVENSVYNDYSDTGTINACERLFSLNPNRQQQTWQASGFWSNRLATNPNSNGLVGNAGGDADRAVLVLNLSYQGKFICVKAANENGSDYIGRLLPTVTVSDPQPPVEVAEEIVEEEETEESEEVSVTEKEDMGNDDSDSVEDVEDEEATIPQKDGTNIQTDIEENPPVIVSEEIDADSGNPSSETEIASSEETDAASKVTVSTTGGSGINWVRLMIYVLIFGAVLAGIYALASKVYGQREN